MSQLPRYMRSKFADYDEFWSLIGVRTILIKLSCATSRQTKLFLTSKSFVDAHFGDGIYEVLRPEPGTLYVSLHRHDDGAYYPGNGSASLGTIGPLSSGRCVSVAWPGEGFGDADYMHAFHTLLLPIINAFEPEL
jgi:hypothetical protein